MKNINHQRTIFCIIIFVFLLGCQVFSTEIQTPSPISPTNTELSITTETVVTPTVASPTLEIIATPTPEKFFSSEFDEEVSGWSFFSINGENSVINPSNIGVNLYVEDSHYVFDIDQKLNWIYSIYDIFIYADVRIDTIVSNRGTNNNNVTLLCRYDEEEGWFEISITNGGLYYIYHAAPRFDGFVAYTVIEQGGSNDIIQGLETNKYTMICLDDTITLLINDEFVKKADVTRFDLNSGKIGISASSFLDVPVKIKFDNVTISQIWSLQLNIKNKWDIK